MADQALSRKQKAAQREKGILEAALEVFSENGFKAATIPQIAARAGVATGSIYNYYPNKRELFIAVVKTLVMDPLLKIVKEQPDKDFRGTLLDIIKNRVDLAEKGIATRLLPLMSEILRDPDLRTVLREQLMLPALDAVEAAYQTGLKSGGFRTVEPGLVSRVVAGLAIGMILVKTVEGDQGPLARIPGDKLAAEMFDFMVYGLSNARPA